MKTFFASAFLLVAACGSEVLAPTPEALGLVVSADVEVIAVFADSSFARLRMEVAPAQCSGLDGDPDPRLEVDEDRLYHLGEDGRLRPTSRGDFVVGRRIRVWWNPDGCQTLSAAALLPQ